MCRFIDSSTSQPVVDKVFPRPEVKAAFSAMRGSALGKIVLGF
jgi:NADPH:quinone reductase-like Zn-dependent oxidoreductase